MARRVKLFIDAGFHRVTDCLDAAGLRVQSIRATCGNPGDEAMLVDIIKEEKGGFMRLDKVLRLCQVQQLIIWPGGGRL